MPDGDPGGKVRLARHVRTGARHARRLADDYRYALRWHGPWQAAAIPAGWTTGTLAPVVLIGGVMEPWSLLRPVGERLHAAGHPVHVVEQLSYNLATLAVGAAMVGDLIRRRDLREVVLVAHSKGGLVGKYAMAHDPERRIDRLIAIATPFGGSSLARLIPLRSIQALRPEDPEIAGLATDTALNARIWSIFPSFDPHVPDGSRLAGATNLQVAAVGHFRVLADEEAITAVLAAAR